ncbi:hypothetical protein OTK49_10515 [Vibrio coralliirubri]|uniref:hypothetical protein n=1 Tax=Vibrio coralliirubri TaxID=1516159 RepID=UPI002284DD34|nr:hypothetical protein [Vibrio coralliirubri]MCY9862972.1 hypothetical protein [Vibrio coralliirubri]
MRFIFVLIITSFPLLAEESGTGSSDFDLGGRAGLLQLQSAYDDAFKCDSDKTGVGIYGEYQFFDWMALEGGLLSMAKLLVLMRLDLSALMFTVQKSPLNQI